MSKIVSYPREQIKGLPSETDWQRPIPSDEEFDAADALDPEVAGIDEAWMKQAIITQPNQKQRIYAAYDAYVLEYFKRGGRGYQARMNAVLKAYVDAQLAKELRKE
jgi:uncharacterized protein (DUF4415 family)